MSRSSNPYGQLVVLVAGLVAMLLVAFAFLSASTPASASAPVLSDPQWSPMPSGTRMWTPLPTRTPCSECTPMATRTHEPWPTGTWEPMPSGTCTPMGTRTHEPWPTGTWEPMGSRTPMATRTHEPMPTGSCTPMGTRTHEPWPTGTWEPWPTRTPMGTRTPMATRTHEPWPSGTRTPMATRTPRPMMLMPRMQFGHADPGAEKVYHEILVNRFTAPDTVNLTVRSMMTWTVAVDPTSLIAQPGVSDTITVTVGVPMSPTFRADIERLTAVSTDTPYTATAYMITMVGHHRFLDMASNHWAGDYVQYLVTQGAVSGYSDGTFRPNDYVTRAQFAKMLVLAMGWEANAPASPTFTDVAAGYWAYPYIETAAAHGVINGYSDGTFRPGNAVTRAQVAKMIVQAREWYLDGETGTVFPDVAYGDWAYTYADIVSAAGVMNGYSDGTFRPYASATRAQIAKILTSALFSDPNN